MNSLLDKLVYEFRCESVHMRIEEFNFHSKYLTEAKPLASVHFPWVELYLLRTVCRDHIPEAYVNMTPWRLSLTDRHKERARANNVKHSVQLKLLLCFTYHSIAWILIRFNVA